jgi:MFS family permease
VSRASATGWALALLFAANALNFFDRQLLGALNEPIRRELALSDAEMGWLATAFTLLYAVAGLPLGQLADRGSRSRLLAGGLALWSALTLASGFARGYWALFAARLGVGLGEAACAPAATSLIGDLVPAARRGRALALFMLGLPVGIALSYLVGGVVAEHAGWRAAFLLAGAPGLLLVLPVLRLQDPPRGTHAEAAPEANGGAAALRLLAAPGFALIVVSGVLHNFDMYALSHFLPALMTRLHGASLPAAGLFSGLVVGVVGGTGIWLGGGLGDRWAARPGGRLRLASLAMLAAAPLTALALSRPSGSLAAFLGLLALAYLLLYVYYAVVYAAIQDAVGPRRRGTAIAVYFLAMYLAGASLGPVALGALSDLLARRAAAAAGAVVTPALPPPEAFRAAGLQGALLVVPGITLLLAVVLWLAARHTAARIPHER